MVRVTHPDTGKGLLTPIFAAFRTAHPQIALEVPPERVTYRANSLVALQFAARAGLGVAPLPCYLGDDDAALVRVKGPVAEMAATLWVLFHPDLRRVARIRAFVDFVVRELTRRRPLLEGRATRPTMAVSRPS